MTAETRIRPATGNSRHALTVLLTSVAGLIAVKFAITAVLARLFGISLGAAVETALLLGPAGEFAFVGIGMAAAFGLLDGKIASFGYALTSVSMALIPLLAAAGRWAGRFWRTRRKSASRA